MRRLIDVILILISMIAGGLSGLGCAGKGPLAELVVSTAALAWLVNLAGLALFIIVSEVFFSAEGVRAVTEVLNTSSIRARVVMAVAGFAFGVVLGGALFSSFIALIPVITFAGLLGVAIAVDFVSPHNRRWLLFRELVAKDIRAKASLIFVGMVVAVTVYSLTVGYYILLLPVTALVVFGILVAIIERVFSRSRVWAVARHTVAESIRTKVALVFIVLVFILLCVTPFVVEGDGLTLKSRVQSYLAYSLGSIGFLLSLLTVFVSCDGLAGEIRNKHVFMVATKPIPRWQFFLGKWLGVSTLNAALLLITCVTVVGFTLYLKRQPTSVPGDREALQYEVLNVRHGFPLHQLDWDRLADRRIRELREQGRWGADDLRGTASRREQLISDLKRTWRTLRPGEAREFEFRDLMVDRNREGYLHLNFEAKPIGGNEDTVFRLVWEAGDLKDPNTRTIVQSEKYLVERVHTLVIPARAVNNAGTLYVRLQNADERDTIAFEGDQGLELLYHIGTFHWNLFRALSIIWCRLAFLAVLGLLLSSCLSFPVACMACFVVLIIASFSGFLGEALEWVSPEDLAAQSGMGFRRFLQAVVWLIPDFSKFDAVENVVNGRLVPLMWVLYGLSVLVLIKGLILGVIGCVALTRRELDRVVV